MVITMRANNVLGIIYSNAYDSVLSELTNARTMGSVPFGGRYRLIDFALSNLVNCGINKVGIITKSNYQSLMDHIGTGKPWISPASAEACSSSRPLTIATLVCTATESRRSGHYALFRAIKRGIYRPDGYQRGLQF